LASEPSPSLTATQLFSLDIISRERGAFFVQRQNHQVREAPPWQERRFQISRGISRKAFTVEALPNAALQRAQAISFDIEGLTANLAVIADWKQELLNKIERTKLIFQLHDCNTDIEPLLEEVAAYKRCCRALSWRAPA
jgi:hypothetical protein